MTIYRLFQARFQPWDATGAKRYGGRWNSPGNAMLYASSNLSLACLEVLVHIRDVYNVPQFSYCAIDVDSALVAPWPHAGAEGERRARAVLDSDVLSREFGDEFLAGAAAPVQTAPSVVIPAEVNYLLNPEHEEFPRLRWSAAHAFEFDPRLLDSAPR